MSLDVHLISRGHRPVEREPRPLILIRRNGSIVEVSREEWDRLKPGVEPVTFTPSVDVDEVDEFKANITHNVNKMADAAGLYIALWRPEEMGATQAKHIVPQLQKGLRELKRDRERYTAMNPANGWGSYEGLVHFTEKYLAACIENPEAFIEVSR